MRRVTTAPSRTNGVAAPMPLPVSLGLRAAGKLFLLGMTLGSALDAIHTHTGTTAYTTPVAFRAAWWVPIEFGLAGVAVGLGRRLVERSFRAETPAPPAPRLLLGLVFFIAAFASSGLLSRHPAVACAVLGALFAAAWILCDRTGIGLLAAALTAATGVAVEVALVRGGLFHYTEPGVLGVSYWLPLLYGTAAIGIGNLGKQWSRADAVGVGG